MSVNNVFDDFDGDITDDMLSQINVDEAMADMSLSDSFVVHVIDEMRHEPMIHSELQETQENAAVPAEEMEIVVPNPVSRGKQRQTHKQEGEQECMICGKSVAKMFDHLKTHDLVPKIRLYLCDYYRTRHRGIAYQCEECLRRFAHRRHHAVNGDHTVTKVTNPGDLDTLYTQVRSICLSNRPTDVTAKQMVFDCVEEEVRTARISGAATDSVYKCWNRNVQEHIAKIFSVTKKFSNLERLPGVIEDIAISCNYKAGTVLNLLMYLGKFADYVTLCRKNIIFSSSSLVKMLEKIKKPWNSAQSREYIKTQDDMMMKVPTTAQLSDVLRQIQRVLQEHNDLSYKALCVLNFVLLQARLDLRPHPILSLSFEDYNETLKKGLKIKTSKHKTGKKYRVTIRIREDQIPHIDKMLEKFQEEYQQEPKLLFPNLSNEYENCMAKNIHETLPTLVNVPEGKCFHPTAVRKTIDTAAKKTKASNPDIYDSHLRQTGHSAKTADENYVADMDSRADELLDFYERLLEEGDSALPVEECNKEKENEEPSQISEPCTSSANLRPKTRGQNLESSQDTEAELEWSDSDDDYLPYVRVKEMQSRLPDQRRRTQGKQNLNITAAKRDRFITSLKTYRGKVPWSDIEKEMIKCFLYVERTQKKEEIRDILEKNKFKAPESSVLKIYDKIKMSIKWLYQ